MSMVLFLPWCPLGSPHTTQGISLLPVNCDEQIEGLDAASDSKVRKILASYRDITGKPIRKATLIQIRGKSLDADLSEFEINKAAQAVSWACLSALASQDYFGYRLNYCNSEHFSLVIQKFGLNTDIIAVLIRRRDGDTLCAWRTEHACFTVPTNCQNARSVSLDCSLLNAMELAHDLQSDNERIRWQNAIDCFNHACNDSPIIRNHVAWVLLASAMQQLLDTQSNCSDFANRFQESFEPPISQLARSADRLKLSPRSRNSVRYHWAREFYTVRGSLAHGRLNPNFTMDWKEHEHLCLATIAFPLILKQMLRQIGCYVHTADDRAQIASFEQFAGSSTFSLPGDSQKPLWPELLDQYRRAEASDAFQTELLACIESDS